MVDETEYPPWPSELLEAKLEGGWLHFYDPNGERAAVPIYPTPKGWNAKVVDSTITVSPSIHQIGHWHTPNPVIFKLVDELKDPKK